MENERQCPVCYATIELMDGAGYCIMCDEVIFETEEGVSSELLEMLMNDEK